MSAKPSSIVWRRPMRTPIAPAGSAPTTPPIAQAMKPIAASPRRNPEPFDAVQAYQVVNDWNTSWTRTAARNTARMPGTAPRASDQRRGDDQSQAGVLLRRAGVRGLAQQQL